MVLTFHTISLPFATVDNYYNIITAAGSFNLNDTIETSESNLWLHHYQTF